jgi:WD40 repeat protein
VSATSTCITQAAPGPLQCGLTRASVVSVSFSPGNDVAPDQPVPAPADRPAPPAPGTPGGPVPASTPAPPPTTPNTPVPTTARAATPAAPGAPAPATPGNGASAFPPPRAPHGARTVVTSVVRTTEEGNVESAEVWDPRTGRVLHTLVKDLEHHGGLQTDWTADGQHVAVAGVGDSHFGFRIYDAAGFVPLHEDAEIRHQFPCALEIDPSETRVAVTTLLGTAAIHDLDTGRSIAALETNPMRAAGHVCSVLQWSGDGKAIQVEGLRESTGLRPLPKRTTRDPRQSIPSEEELVQASFAPRGDVAAFLDRRGNVRLFGRNGVVPIRVIAAGKDVPPPADSTAPVVRALSWRPDATALATWDHTGRVRVWDPAKGTLVRELRASGPRLEGLPDPEMEDARLTWSPDGRWITFWSGERPELWSLDDGTQRLASQSVPKPEVPTLPSMRFSPDGALLAVDRTLWDTKSGALTRQLPAPADHWLDSGRFLSLASDHHHPGPLRILRVSDGAVLSIERLGDDLQPILLAHTEDGVFQGPRHLAGCALPTLPAAPAPPPSPSSAPATAGALPPAAPRLTPERRDTLLADFWAGRPVARTCPAP